MLYNAVLNTGGDIFSYRTSAAEISHTSMERM